MITTDDKILIHFSENYINTYILKENALLLLNEYSFSSEYSSVNDLLQKIDLFFNHISNHVEKINNKNTRLYATGIFQKLTQINQTKLTIHIYTNYGLLFNIIRPDLERFYLKRSNNANSMMEGLIRQEFRKVVICGSFQQHLKKIEDIMTVLHQRGIDVLSPWTTKVQPETLGTDFILLEGQEPLKNERDSWKHKYEHMNKFRQADAIIICNPYGSIGKGTIFELGFMIAISKRIIFMKEPKNLSVLFPYEIGLIF